MTGNTIQITPFMHVAEIDLAVRFFVDLLGFTAVIHRPDYAYVEREGAAIRIQQHDDLAEIAPGTRGFAYYIDVRDLDLVLGEIWEKLEGLPDGDVYGPVDQQYGQRELLIRAPDGNLVVFGQAIA